jgi:hypothetical protein
MTCGKRKCQMCHHGQGPGPGGWEGKHQCLDKEKQEIEEKEE